MPYLINRIAINNIALYIFTILFFAAPLIVCPQEPSAESLKPGQIKTNLYYKEMEVRFSNKNIKLAGTLSIPFSQMKHPAVILISDKGAQKHNNNNQGFEIFRILADNLTRNNFVVLRLDDRGTGGSGGKTESSSLKDLSSDISKAVNFLKSRPEVDPEHIGLLGHGQGGLIAAMTAASNPGDIDFIILSSTGVLPEDKLLVAEFKNLLSSEGRSNEFIQSYIQALQKYFDLVRSGISKGLIKTKLYQYILNNYDKMPAPIKREFPEKIKYAKTSTDRIFKETYTSNLKDFLNIDPIGIFQNIKCPVLAVFGGKDIEVTADENKAALTEALNKGGNKALSIRVFPDANHLFQTAETGSKQEYPQLKKDFLPGYIDCLNEWLRDLFPQEN